MELAISNDIVWPLERMVSAAGGCKNGFYTVGRLLIYPGVNPGWNRALT